MDVDGQQERAQPLASTEPTAEEQPLLRRFEGHVWRRVASGLLVLIPLAVTFLILKFVIEFIDEIFQPLLEHIHVFGTDLYLPGTSTVALMLVLFYVIGAFFAGRRSQALQDAVLTRVPVVKSIYSVARQATDAIASPSAQHFKRVVFVEWPRPGVRALGFVTGHTHAATEDGATMVVVYIPTVPNPTSGNLTWVPATDVIESHFSVEEAMKIVFSGGIVLPEVPAGPSLQTPPQIDEGQDS